MNQQSNSIDLEYKEILQKILKYTEREIKKKEPMKILSQEEKNGQD